jgi:hypothetical protein
MKRISIAILFSLAACTDPADEVNFDEPALTSAELAALAEVTADEHEHDALVDTVSIDDVAAFDDDTVEDLVEQDVIDDEDPAVAAVPASAAPLLKAGLHPRASDALRAVGITAGRITQTIGNAPASAGYHKADGSVNGRPYTAAVDLSTSGLSTAQIHNLLEKLGKVGYAAWYRQNGRDGWSGANHIHGVYANCKMKLALRSQIRSWLAGRNGLVSNTIYQFHRFSAAARNKVKAKFAQSNNGTSNGGGGISARVDTAGAPLTIRAGASTSTAAVGSVADGAFVTISCQRTGQAVTGTFGRSTLWDKIGGGYISDAFVATGSDGRVAPVCP